MQRRSTEQREYRTLEREEERSGEEERKGKERRRRRRKKIRGVERKGGQRRGRMDPNIHPTDLQIGLSRTLVIYMVMCMKHAKVVT